MRKVEEGGKAMTTKYLLVKDGMQIEFNSEKEACDFLGVCQCVVAGAFFHRRKCKGWDVYNLGPHVPTRTAGLRVNGWVMPNKTEREYYRYREGRKA